MRQAQRRTVFTAAKGLVDRETRFGAMRDYLSPEQFDSLFGYLQSRIDRTRLDSMNGSKGVSNYSTYPEFVQKYESR